MSGAVAAHAAYNNSGTQALAVTNKIDGEEDVLSVFWNKNDTLKQLLYGSAVLEIPTSGTGSGSTFGGSQIFTVNNDIDCLGDLWAAVTVTGAVHANDVGALAPFGLVNAIKRIEFQVGTQIWQTLEKDDLLGLLSTELSESAYEKLGVQANGWMSSTGKYHDGASKDGAPAAAAGLSATYFPSGTADCMCYVPLHLITKTLAPRLEKFSDQTEGGYPMAAAPHQSVKIKLVYASTAEILTTTPHADTKPILNVKLLGKHQIMCNEERQSIKSMPNGVPKRLKMTQNSHHASGAAATETSFDLDHFSLYASHILIQADALASDANAATCGLEYAELKLNSSSYSGKLDGTFLRFASGESMGLYGNDWYVAKTSEDGDSSATLNDTGTRAMRRGTGYYVFPLASRAYGGSGVPFNRFDNIRLTLKFTCAVSAVNITCVGETTALFKGGSASLAMY